MADKTVALVVCIIFALLVVAACYLIAAGTAEFLVTNYHIVVP